MNRPFSDRPPAPTITVALCPHPTSPATTVRGIRLSARSLEDGSFAFAFRLEGEVAGLWIPAPQPPGPADDLWKHTCFEVFVGEPGEEAYREFNFSPSGQWAAYAFGACRVRDAANDPHVAPQIVFQREDDALGLDVVLPAAALPACAPGTSLPVGVAAVLETAGGGLAYWALHHAAPMPDFHQRASFAMVLTTPPAKG
ncbi:DOMON-like domain-containing protein [Thauera sinica]|uniref:DOMON-like domain-containing protein n=1 Tax=Thauera sinica TaxID=2665146 RepID=A0ABW1ASA4_9RHOO|nr:DOMON-like domain-containing protein [Thauera sp. K11]ATE61469.1 hypothetical protein CCZ27_17275 [Thauera sp. K11]